MGWTYFTTYFTFHATGATASTEKGWISLDYSNTDDEVDFLQPNSVVLISAVNHEWLYVDQ